MPDPVHAYAARDLARTGCRRPAVDEVDANCLAPLPIATEAGEDPPSLMAGLALGGGRTGAIVSCRARRKIAIAGAAGRLSRVARRGTNPLRQVAGEDYEESDVQQAKITHLARVAKQKEERKVDGRRKLGLALDGGRQMPPATPRGPNDQAKRRHGRDPAYDHAVSLLCSSNELVWTQNVHDLIEPMRFQRSAWVVCEPEANWIVNREADQAQNTNSEKCAGTRNTLPQNWAGQC